MKKEVTEDKTTEECPLCGDSSSTFYKEESFLCTECKDIFRSRETLPTISEERPRYEKHDNDINDEGYQDFVSPMTEAVKKRILSKRPGA